MGKETHNDKHDYIKDYMFFVINYIAIDKDILDLTWHLATRMKFGTCKQNWDLFGTISGLWSQLGQCPKFGTSLQALCAKRKTQIIFRKYSLIVDLPPIGKPSDTTNGTK